MTKEEKELKLKGIFQDCHMQPVAKWTSDNKDKLKEYMEAEVTLADMALGRQQDMMKQQIVSAGVALSKEDLTIYRK